MSTQSEALRLADELATDHVYGVRQGIPKQAAAELRRLHAVNAELLAALGRLIPHAHHMLICALDGDEPQAEADIARARAAIQLATPAAPSAQEGK